jgi:hypothetical protein
MVAVQWGMTETLIEQHIYNLIGDDPDLLAEYQKIRNFRGTLKFFQTQIELKAQEPLRSNVLALVTRIQNLASQRHDIMHRLWGGGMPEDSWNNPGNIYPESDAVLLRQPGDKPKKTKSEDARASLHWQLTFSGIRKIATEMATLNRDLFMIFAAPPDGQQPAA